MKRIWNFFSSIELTIALAVLICMDAAWGSLVAVKAPGLSRALDQAVLFPWLARYGGRYLSLTLWIFILVLLVAIFTVNTAVCTVDKVNSIIKARRPWQSFFPHIVHIGFLIALMGHLAGSLWGFRSPNNFIFQGEVKPVPGLSGVYMRLDSSDMVLSPEGEPESISDKLTVLEGSKEAATDVIRINGPMIYRGTAFYHVDQGLAPYGLRLGINGESVRAPFEGSFKAADGSVFRLGQMYPDYAVDPSGRPYSRSGRLENPHIEVIGPAGETAILDMTRRGASVRLGAKTIALEDYITSSYVILNINKDPGIWLIITGSSILVAGMVLLLFFRGGRGELIRERKEPA